ncbi:hypothetical protein [Streptomyces sp. CAU 1734]|uniref:hypothetical protein n=1 Tax=Streptomyces sp. CAU 1734 TaxID=3140360 RepID=UPI003260129B
MPRQLDCGDHRFESGALAFVALAVLALAGPLWALRDHSLPVGDDRPMGVSVREPAGLADWSRPTPR